MEPTVGHMEKKVGNVPDAWAYVKIFVGGRLKNDLSWGHGRKVSYRSQRMGNRNEKKLWETRIFAF